MKRIPKAVIAISIIGAVIVAAMFLLPPRIAPVADTPDPVVVEQAAVTPGKTNELPEPPAQSQPTLGEKMQKYNGRWFGADYHIKFNQSGVPVAVGTFVDIDIDRYGRGNSITITRVFSPSDGRVARVQTPFKLEDETAGIFEIKKDAYQGAGRIYFRDRQLTVEIHLDAAGVGEEESFNGAKTFIKNGAQPLAFDDLRLGDLGIGMFYDEVIRVMSNPDREEGSDKNLNWNMFFSDGTEVTMIDGRVYQIYVGTEAYPTPRGFKVGDTKEQVAKVYGPPKEIYEENGNCTWWYGMSEDLTNMGIDIKNGRVEGLYVWIRYD